MLKLIVRDLQEHCGRHSLKWLKLPSKFHEKVQVIGIIINIAVLMFLQ